MGHVQLARRFLYVVIAVMTGVAAVTGCGGADRPDDRPRASIKTEGAHRPVHDPPVKFATDAGIAMPMEATSGRLTVGGTLDGELPVVLNEQIAFVAAPDNVQAVDTATGNLVGRIEPSGSPLGSVEAMGDDNPAQAPVIVKGAGFTILVAPFVVETAGTGTQAEHTLVELTGSNAETAKVMWRLPVRLPSWADSSYSTVSAVVVGTLDHIGVLTVANDDHAVSYGIDLAAHRILWTQAGFDAVAVAGSTAVGATVQDGTRERAVGYDVTSGKRKWFGEHSYELSVRGAGPHLITVNGRDYGSGDSYYRLLDARTGTVRQNLPSGLFGSSCRYDAKDTVVCAGMGSQSQVVCALDATSGKMLWQLPDKQADRIAPEVAAAWHGRVYGETGNGPVILDARSGDDVPAHPAIVPRLLNESTALALDDSGDQLMAYPTAG
ncbi:hypothetical protein [Streptomyces sp. NPDC005525]|uniref:hypothetical protein n=1 Tax=Streptomyces sp. NPDC005525 TaxID=3364720 RepID=UPI003686231A